MNIICRENNMKKSHRYKTYISLYSLTLLSCFLITSHSYADEQKNVTTNTTSEVVSEHYQTLDISSQPSTINGFNNVDIEDTNKNNINNASLSNDNTNTKKPEDIQQSLDTINNYISDEPGTELEIIDDTNTTFNEKAINTKTEQTYTYVDDKNMSAVVDTIYKTADTYRYRTPFSIDETISDKPSDQVVIDTTKLFTHNNKGYSLIKSETPTVRDMANSSVGTVKYGDYGATIDTPDLYKDSPYFGKWSSRDRLYRYFSAMSTISSGNYNEKMVKSNSDTSYQDVSQARKIVPTYLYADFKADYLRFRSEYATLTKEQKTSDIITMNNEATALYNAYTRKYNLWMGYDVPVSIIYADNTQNHSKINYVKSVVNDALKVLPSEWSHYLGTITYYDSEDARYGYTYSIDGRIFLNLKYLGNASKTQIVHTLTHEVGHIIDGSSFIHQNETSSNNSDVSRLQLISFSRVKPFETVSNKHFNSGQIWEDFANTIADYYSNKIGYETYFKDKLKDETAYLEKNVLPYLKNSTIKTFNISKDKQYQYIGATSIKEKNVSNIKAPTSTPTVKPLKFNAKAFIKTYIATHYKNNKPFIILPRLHKK